MKIIEAGFQILDVINGEETLKKIEKIGRVCYKSELLISNDSAKQFVRKIISSGHESVVEHEKLSVKIICDRGVSHEIVRHRIASYSQESTRYCNYADNKFGNELTFVKPCFWNEDDEKYNLWVKMMEQIECSYLKLIELGAKPEEARSILPNSLKTEIVMTMNFREWRHFFKLRTSVRAHPQMREVACALLEKLKAEIPIIFDDIE